MNTDVESAARAEAGTRQIPHRSAACPMCGHGVARPSWFGSTRYLDQRFDYVECQSCGSLYCDPMPDDRTVAHMYGPGYEPTLGTSPGEVFEDPKEALRVAQWLAKRAPGTFVDYGCGNGRLLTEVRKLGWHAVGFEIDPAVAQATAARTGVEVVTDLKELRSRFPADVLHLGDVIEHLTDLAGQMPEILSVIKPGGVLLAQGPLEANGNLFTWALRGQRVLRGSPTSQFGPYHVLLATAKGQRGFFRRFGLEEIEYHVQEVDWPAPSRLTLAELRRPRTVALFALRRASRAVSRLRPAVWGNRYFYAGRRSG